MSETSRTGTRQHRCPGLRGQEGLVGEQDCACGACERVSAPATYPRAEWAKREAMARLREQHGMNAAPGLPELAYSPSTAAVGWRWNWGAEPHEPFRVFNVNYPMYGRSDEVTDWVSVGIARPDRRKS